MLSFSRNFATKHIKHVVVGFVAFLLSGPSLAQDWSDIDFWEMEISESECAANTPPFTQLCEIRDYTFIDLAELRQRVEEQAPRGAYLIEYENQILTIASLSEERNSFICCDIQAPFRSLTSDFGPPISIAVFGVPEGSFLQIDLLNGVDVIGPTSIGMATSEYQAAYLNTLEDDRVVPYETITVPGFARDVYIYRNTPERTPNFIFYVKDGSDAAHMFGPALATFYGEEIVELPSFALVGIESGDRDRRRDEYLRNRTLDVAAFDQYWAEFSDIIVPFIEDRLGYTNGPSGRVLVGKSNGGRWVLDYSLRHPGFACNVITMSIAGQVPDASEVTSLRQQQDCRRYFVSAGQLESAAFVDDTEEIHQLLVSHEIPTDLVIENSGHDFSTWVPSFLRFFQEIIGEKAKSRP